MQAKPGTRPGPGEPALINELVRRRLGISPHATAVEFGEHKLTWRKFDERIRHLASGLRAARVQPGERFGVLSNNHPACLEAVFAAALTGSTAVILDWRLPDSAIIDILRREQVTLLLAGTDFAELLERVRPELDDLDTVVMVGRPRHGGSDDYELWLELHETGEGMYEAAKYRPTLDDLVLQVHRDEGGAHVALSHRALQEQAEQAGSTTPAAGSVNEAAVVVVSEPLFLAKAVVEALQAIGLGARTVLIPV
jgi:acyl-CoA synthetase (AMP-forming)/AMP-acid ligase II